MSQSTTTWTDQQVSDTLDVDTAIASQRRAFDALGRGEAQMADKVALSHANGADTTLCYVSKLSPAHGVVSKLIAVHPHNAQRGLPVISATVLVLDATTGRLVATLEGTALTAIRTAAGSAVAADALAAPDVDVLAVLGSGVQARGHVRAIARVRTLREVRIHSPSRTNREAAAEELSTELGLDVRAVDSPPDAVRGAAMVATCTLSKEPVFATADLDPGATVLSVGSFQHDRFEVDAELVRRASMVVVDDVDTAVRHAGPIVRALESGVMARRDMLSLADVLHRSGRERSRDDIAFFNSVGLGVQDAAAAHAVLGTL